MNATPVMSVFSTMCLAGAFCLLLATTVAERHVANLVDGSADVSKSCISNTTRLNQTTSRVGTSTPLNWRFVKASEMPRLLTKFDRFQTFLSTLLKNRERPSQPKYKIRPTGREELHLECGGYTTGGQDAFKIDGERFAVADGVGGSALSPSNFSVDLCDYLLQSLHPDAVGNTEPEELMTSAIRDAHVRATAAHNDIVKQLHSSMGLMESTFDTQVSSTILGAAPSIDGKHLIVGNIGDSGLSIYRRLATNRLRRTATLHTEARQTTFNQPRQVTTKHPQSAEQIDYYRMPIREGDLIIAMSDGLIDNLYFGELHAIINRAVSPYESTIFSEYYELSQAANNKTQSGAPMEGGTSTGGSPATETKNPWKLPTWADIKYKFAGDSKDLNDSWRYTTPPGLLAKFIVLAGRWASVQSDGPPPFYLSWYYDAMEFHKSKTGKPDDVTATVCWVVSSVNNQKSVLMD